MLKIFAAGMIALAQAADSPPASHPTIQQQFEAASQATSSGNWEAALAGYQALETRLANGRSRRSMAIVRVRKGEALAKLGRQDEASTALRVGLDALPASDASLAGDRFIALSLLATISEQNLDFPAANRDYQFALASSSTFIDRLQMLGGLARTEMFDDSMAALKHVDQALAELAATPAPPEGVRAQFRTLRGRALLNRGEFKAARADLEAAMKELGGLTLKVDQADIAARSDLAIAAMLAGDPVGARKYLAYTGAGNLKGDGLARGADMRLPACAGPEGIRPDDVAVIQFAIREDGTVRGVTPIYASRPGQGALGFARAVAHWSWNPEQARKIEPFFREITRVELRCSTALQRPTAESLLSGETQAWLDSRKAPPFDLAGASYAAGMPELRGELARREVDSGVSSVNLLPVLLAIAANPVTPADEAERAIGRADAIARGAAAPGSVLAYLAVGRASAVEAAAWARGRRGGQGPRQILADALRDPAILADPTGSAAIRVTLSDHFVAAHKRAEALGALREVVADNQLGPRNPLRIAALIRIAALEVARGDLSAARTNFEQTGLSAQQCALVDAKPALVRHNSSSSDFPREAMRWGFEGWVATEFDITAVGKTQNVRPVIAYPPFIFGTAASDILKGASFTQSYRPGGGLGCGGQQQSVRFGLPG